MHVLSLVHGDSGHAGVFGEVARRRGHTVEQWSFVSGKPLPRPLEDYLAVFVFGGSMHADQEEQHPWLREEGELLARLLGSSTPVLGVCLGAQLLAKAAGGAVYPARQPEIGWVPVELTNGATDDPLFAHLPRHFDAFQWHYYTYDLPSGADELARSGGCTQAFRLGVRTWAIQFHAEVTQAQIEDWIAGGDGELPLPAEELRAQTRRLVRAWNEIGRSISSGFLELAEASAARR
jgi:GMP synthase (glutamine-hydrolysing)